MFSRSTPPAARTVVHLLETPTVWSTAQLRFLTELARALDPDRYRLQAWFLHDSGPVSDVLAGAGVPSRAVLFRGRRDPLGALRFARALRAESPELVHLHVGGRARLVVLRAVSSAKRVAHLWGERAEDDSPLPLEHLARDAHAVIATSKAVAATIETPSTVVYPGVEVDDALARRPSGPPTIGTCGRLEPVKGLPFLLEAAALLLPRHPDLRIELAGSGSCEPRLRSLAEELGIASSVTFLGWRNDIDVLHRRWIAFAQPSLTEGLPFAALEAMAAGLPVVASATGGLPELIEDGRTGFLVPVGAVGVLADRIGTLLEDDALRVRLGEAGRQRVRERFSIPQMVAGITQIYERLLEE